MTSQQKLNEIPIDMGSAQLLFYSINDAGNITNFMGGLSGLICVKRDAEDRGQGILTLQPASGAIDGKGSLVVNRGESYLLFKTDNGSWIILAHYSKPA